MGRENHDPTIVHSSIALLQERFRQLERVKEMREERELKRMLNEPKQQTYDQSTTRLSSSNHELIIPSRSSPPHVSLSLWPTTSSQANSWKNGYDCDSSSVSGVDTSLHL
ncbi:unnamed protein product [Vicia faba]|uniref:Uncharacterized protein n=1 Tax=Vicia faba TaxID=3906 RepID=A0AAV0YZC9_VICFA|nr:unnamed protein product [Vicia faba]